MEVEINLKMVNKNISWKELIENPFSIQIGNVVPCLICRNIEWCKITKIENRVSSNNEEVWGIWYEEQSCITLKHDLSESYMYKNDFLKTIEKIETGELSLTGDDNNV